jgi:L-ribulokinase
MPGKYAIGLDFGTNSVRALVVDVRDGRELGEAVSDYGHGERGVIVEGKDPHLARQHPADYLAGITASVKAAIKQAGSNADFSPGAVIGIGVDTTGSTPLPVDASGRALALLPQFKEDPDAMAWLWKDHTSHKEAAEMTDAALKHRPQYLSKCGGRYSSEWFWAKILRCARVAPQVSAAAASWVEIADWIPAVLCGTTPLSQLRRGVCASGHKAFYNASWGGFADEGFLAQLHPELGRIRRSLPNHAYTVGEPAGTLCAEWAQKLGLRQGIPVAIGAFDAHLGAIGAGVGAGTLVKVIGTSTCDIMVSPLKQPLADIPGLCGIVPESVLPGFFGLEAGQSAVGDIFNWFVNQMQPGGSQRATHEALSSDAERLHPGQSGLLALDWHNGNRTILVDQRLTGMVLGLSLQTTPAEVYRALVEATAFGARMIVERLEEYGVPAQRVVNCGGIAARNPVVMQIYADVLNRPIAIARSLQTCALGSAIAASVVAGKERGGHGDFDSAIKAMAGVQPRIFTPDPRHAAVYERIFRLYCQVHDAFGIAGNKQDLSGVMKDLLAIRDEVSGE